MIDTHEFRINDFLLNPRNRLLRHVLLQGMILLISFSSLIDGFGDVNFSSGRFYGWIGYYFIINLLVYINIYWLAPRFLIKNKMVRYLLSVIVLIAVILLIAVVIQSLFEDSEGPVRGHDISAILLTLFSSVFSIGLLIAGSSAALFFRYWLRYGHRRNELQTAALQSELQYLKSQINPHFLFNMLNNANIMAEENPSLSSHILSRLDDLLRYQFEDSGRDHVLLASDIAFLTDFLELEKTRRDHFDYTVEQKSLPEEVRIPPLLFIPFVENAVKHNTDGMEAYVHLSFDWIEGGLHFVCENSKRICSVAHESSGLGLANIQRRLELLFPQRYILTIKDRVTVYTVNLQIKLDENEVYYC